MSKKQKKESEVLEAMSAARRPMVVIDFPLFYETFDQMLRLADLHEVSPKVYLRRLVEADTQRWEFG
jgi:hypothetical protein